MMLTVLAISIEGDSKLEPVTGHLLLKYILVAALVLSFTTIYQILTP